ncbi:MAG: flavin reductase, partial [Cyclobacteriaceae bacterium]|nr:flavin reductase [Cyclobacteriaceae bacterium]
MRRPWNIVNSPVYALLTSNGAEFNANICTYVMAVSRKPKLYALALEHHSKTLDLLEENPQTVLQMLTKQQIWLVAPLGKKSGFKFSKRDYLEKNYGLSNWQCWP